MPNILITNDDGIKSRGIIQLADELSKKFNVYVVAPHKQRSCMSHAIKFLHGVSYEKISDEPYPKYSVDGTPADCVMFGLKVIFSDIKFDAIISGINDVLNIGTDYLYSGTVGAAQEGTMLKVKSIALSVNENKNTNYADIAKFVSDNFEKLIKHASSEITLNINFPNVPFKDIKGVKVCEIARRQYEEIFVTNPDGKHISVGNPLPIKNYDANTDETQIALGYITITPIKILSNDFEKIKEMSTEIFELKA